MQGRQPDPPKTPENRFLRVYESQMEMLKKREIYIKNQRVQKEREIDASLTLRPEITKRGKRMKNRGFKQLNKWHAKKQNYLRAERDKKVRELKKNSSSPKLSKKTARIIAKQKKSGKYQGPVSGWSENVRKYNEKRFPFKTPEPIVFIPQVSEKSKKIVKKSQKRRDGVVFDRLFNQHEENKAKLVEKKENFHFRFHQPLIKPTKKTRFRNPNAVFDNLYINAFEQKRRKNIKKYESQKARVKASPKISKTSRVIAKNMKKRKPLYNPKKVKRYDNDDDQNSNKFVPKRTEGQLDRFFGRLYNRNVKFLLRKDQENQKRAEDKVEDEIKKCTFEPELSPHTLELAEQRELSHHHQNWDEKYEPEERHHQFLRTKENLLREIDEMHLMGDSDEEEDEDEEMADSGMEDESESEDDELGENETFEKRKRATGGKVNISRGDDGKTFEELIGIENEINDAIQDWRSLNLK